MKRIYSLTILFALLVLGVSAAALLSPTVRAEVLCPAPPNSSHLQVRSGSASGPLLADLVGYSSHQDDADTTEENAYTTITVPAGTVLYINGWTVGVEGVNRSLGSGQRSNLPSTVSYPDDLSGYYPNGYAYYKRATLNAFTDPIAQTGSIAVSANQSCWGGFDDSNSYAVVNVAISGGNSSNTIAGSGNASLAIYDTPNVTLEINGSNSATIAAGSSATLAWTPYNTESGTACAATGSWSGAKNSTPGITYTENTGPLSPGTYTYSLSCTGGAASSSPAKTVTLIVSSATLPTTAITANGTSGSISVPYNSAVTIDWSSTNADSCSIAPTNWSGASGSQSTGPLTTTTTYVSNCTNSAGSASASVVVNVGSMPDFSLTCNPPTQSIAAGSSGAVSITSTAANGFNSPIAISVASINPAVANPPVIIFSNNNQSPPATTTALIQTNGSTTPGTYTIDFQGVGNGLTRNCLGRVSFTVAPAAPTVTISANNQTGSITIPYNTGVTVDWSSTNAIGCTIDPTNWAGTSGSQSTGPLTTTTTYTAVCSGPGGSANANVIVNVTPPPPTNLNVDVITNCSKADLTWAANQGAVSGFNVYRSTDGSVWQKITSTPLSASTLSYQDAPPIGNYYYAVTSLSGGIESGKRQSGVVAVQACVSNISTSDKDIIAASPTAIDPLKTNIQPCNAQSDPVVLTAGKSFKVNDIITFRINICNTGNVAAQSVQVVDTLANLGSPGNYSYQGCSAGSENVSGSTITFSVGTVAANGTCSITFSATVKKPASGSIYRFQNSATITAANLPSRRVQTPAYLFTDVSGNPDRNEISP